MGEFIRNSIDGNRNENEICKMIQQGEGDTIKILLDEISDAK